MTFDSSLESQQWVETLREAIEEAVELCGILTLCCFCFRMTFDSSLEGQQWVETLREAIEEAVELCGILTLCCYVSE